MANNSNIRTEPKEILGLNRITKKRLLELCKKDKLYQTASLNDVLYLHYQGFQCIEGLEDYTELKCLWLECNAISEIQGLENQTKLKCLFLQSNLIKKIENLGCCKELDTINLSQNHIRKIENVGADVLPVLNTLNISSNYLKDCEDLKGLENCLNLSVLDLSNNRIDDILVVKVFAKMPELKVLVLQGNPVVSKIPQYRKTLILECKKLTYLDSRPVFPKDRACAEAWKRGGYEEERKESERWNRKERRKMRDSVNATIRMRNKCRKPEDHLTLLVSSDSEDEPAKTKRKRQQQEIDAGVDMELGIWDEVTGDDNTSETASSSDMNVSSSTSVISTTDSNDHYSSANSKCSGSQEISGNRNNEEKLLNVSTDADTKVCRLAESENMKEILNFINQSNKMEALEQQETSEKQIERKETALENEAKDNALGGCDLPYKCQRENDIPMHPTTEDFTSEDDNTPTDSYNDTIDVISRVTMNDLSQSVAAPERRVQLQIETTQDYEPFNEMEAAMKKMVKQEDIDGEKARQLNSKSNGQHVSSTKTPTQIEYERECSAANKQLENDFEQISTNMDTVMVQLQKEKEQRKEVFESLFTEKVAKYEVSSSGSGSEAEGNVDKCRFERIVDQWDKDTRLKGVRGRLEGDAIDEKYNDGRINENQVKEGNNSCKQLKHTPQNAECEVQIEQHTAYICEKLQSDVADIFVKEFEDQPDACERQAREENESELLVCGQVQGWKADENGTERSEKIYKTSQEPEEKVTLEHGLETKQADHNETTLTFNAASGVDDDYVDVTSLTRASNQALSSFEKEAKELKDLLQKLENDNDDLFKELNAECKCQAEENSQGSNDKCLKDDEENATVLGEEEESTKEERLRQRNDCIQDSIENKEEQTDETEDICEETVSDIIESLALQPTKPKIYDFPGIESDEEDYSYSQTRKAAKERELPLSSTIRGVIDSITDIFKNEHFHNFSNIQQRERLTTSSNDKAVILKKLTGQHNLKDFNQDTHQSLDNLLDEYKEQQRLEIRQMVDRVYAQKDRYDDSIELIDGKLMVVNKDTGELKELSSRVPHSSSGSDVDYDTAQSEDDGACCSKPRARRVQFSRQRTGNPNRERIQYNFFQAKEQDVEESDDEFYSLDPHMKTNVYGNIDKEFFDKLSLDHLKFSKQDEDHVVQCTRSYEELKSLLTLSEEERRCTVEEHALLEKMRDGKSTKVVEEEGRAIKELTNDEERLLQKMMQRTKTKKGMERESQGSLRLNNQYDVVNEGKPYWQSNKAIKIFEYKCEGNEQPDSWEPDIDDLAGNVVDANVAVYNFIHDDTAEKENSKLDKGACIETEDSKQIKENLNLIESREQNYKENSTGTLFGLGKLSEAEKNEIENNVDIEGMHLKGETTIEKRSELETPYKELKKKVGEKDDKTNEINQPHVKLVAKELQNVAELPDKEEFFENLPSSKCKSIDNETSAVFPAENSHDLCKNSFTLISTLRDHDGGGTIRENASLTSLSADVVGLQGEYSPTLEVETTENITSAEREVGNYLYLCENAQVCKATLKPDKYHNDDDILDYESQSLPTTDLHQLDHFSVPDPGNTEICPSKYSNVDDSQISNSMLTTTMQDHDGEIPQEHKTLAIDEKLHEKDTPTPQYECTEKITTTAEESKGKCCQYLSDVELPQERKTLATAGQPQEEDLPMPQYECTEKITTTAEECKGKYFQYLSDVEIPQERRTLATAEQPQVEDLLTPQYEYIENLTSTAEESKGEYFQYLADEQGEQFPNAGVANTNNPTYKECHLENSQNFFEYPQILKTIMEEAGEYIEENITESLSTSVTMQEFATTEEGTATVVDDLSDSCQSMEVKRISGEDPLQHLPETERIYFPRLSQTSVSHRETCFPVNDFNVVISEERDDNFQKQMNTASITPHFYDKCNWETNFEQSSKDNLSGLGVNQSGNVAAADTATHVSHQSTYMAGNNEENIQTNSCSSQNESNSNLKADSATTTNPLPTDMTGNNEENSNSIPFLNSPDVDILECNLEILDCNEEVIDIITVNAELHYDF